MVRVTSITWLISKGVGERGKSDKVAFLSKHLWTLVLVSVVMAEKKQSLH